MGSGTSQSLLSPDIYQDHHRPILYYPGVDFTNILFKAFMSADPKYTKNTVKPSFFFALLESACVKAACKM